MSNKRRLLIGSGIGILCVLGCMGVLGIRLLISIFPVSISSPKLSAEQPLGEGEAIAFSLMRLDLLRPFELYILDDVNGIRSLSQGLKRSDLGPVWSPDGKQIIFKSVSGGMNRFYIVDEDGSNRRQISLGESHKGVLRWSPDGSRLAYLTYDQQSDGTISNTPYLCVTDVTTGDTHQGPAGNIQDLVWIADSQSLLAIVRADDLFNIEVYDASGNHERRISEADYPQDATNITISPDASKVAYFSSGADEDIESMDDSLYISAIDGSATKAVGTLWTDGSIVWSPDSTRIALVAFSKDFENALYVANVDGTELQELMLINTGDESGEIVPAAPAWSPDGARIAIATLSSHEGSGVFVMNADGTERRQIIAIAGNDGMIYDLAWKPGE